MLTTTNRLKNANDVVDSFKLDPVYLKSDRQQGQSPDYRVNRYFYCVCRSRETLHL
jgi:hypothetical protein